MKHIILDIRTAAAQLRISSRLLEPLKQAVLGTGKTKTAATGISARQLEAEKQAQADRARHNGEASAATRSIQFLR